MEPSKRLMHGSVVPCLVLTWSLFHLQRSTMFKPLDIKTSPGGSYCHHGTGGLGVIPAIHLGLVILNAERRIKQLGCQVHATAKWMLGFIGYYGLAAAPPITAMVVSVCSDGRSQVSSLDLFTFSNLQTNLYPQMSFVEVYTNPSI